MSHIETLYQKESELSEGFSVTKKKVLIWSCLFWDSKWQTGLELHKLQTYFLRPGKPCQPSVPWFPISKKENYCFPRWSKACQLYFLSLRAVHISRWVSFVISNTALLDSCYLLVTLLMLHIESFADMIYEVVEACSPTACSLIQELPHDRNFTTAELMKWLQSSSWGVQATRDQSHTSGVAAFRDISTNQSKWDR